MPSSNYDLVTPVDALDLSDRRFVPSIILLMESGQQNATGATSSHAINASPPRNQYTIDITGTVIDKIALNQPQTRDRVHSERLSFRRSIGSSPHLCQLTQLRELPLHLLERELSHN